MHTFFLSCIFEHFNATKQCLTGSSQTHVQHNGVTRTCQYRYRSQVRLLNQVCSLDTQLVSLLIQHFPDLTVVSSSLTFMIIDIKFIFRVKCINVILKHVEAGVSNPVTVLFYFVHFTCID